MGQILPNLKRTQALIVTSCVILLGNLSYLARIYTDHGKQAMLVKHVRCNLTRGRGGAWRKDRERVTRKSERIVCLISTT